MQKKRGRFQAAFLSILIVSCICACGDQTETSSRQAASKASFTIVSGSENKGLEPLIQAFARGEGETVHIKYMGSVDMTLMLAEQGKNIPYDAVWPANSLWITLGDRHRVVKHAESVLRSPVVLGVKKSAAERLGWIDRAVSVSDILDATQAGRLRFAMTSATQSNSGACAYLGFLHAMAGSPDVLQKAHLDDPAVREKVRKLLSKVDRSSGSSGWLKETLVNHYERFQAMFNYEALIIEANQEITRMGKEPLIAVYPKDGIMIADSPLGYVDKGDAKKEAFFKKLQTRLLSDEAQQQIMGMGRRTGLVGMYPERVDKNVFNPAWGVDVTRIISPVPTPDEEVIRLALELYQTVLRKPSCTAYVVDVSGSMKGKGITELKAALTTLFDPDLARRYMLQPSPRDIHIIIPFNSRPVRVLQAAGNSPETMNQLVTFVQQLSPGGGTNIYAAAAQALQSINRIENLSDYFSAVILMTDGRSQGEIDVLKKTMNALPIGYDTPIFSITFGDADESQLKAISDVSIGRVFHGGNLVKAFRQAKGYN